MLSDWIILGIAFAVVIFIMWQEITLNNQTDD